VALSGASGGLLRRLWWPSQEDPNIMENVRFWVPGRVFGGCGSPLAPRKPGGGFEVSRRLPEMGGDPPQNY